MGKKRKTDFREAPSAREDPKSDNFEQPPEEDPSSTPLDFPPPAVELRKKQPIGPPPDIPSSSPARPPTEREVCLIVLSCFSIGSPGIQAMNARLRKILNDFEELEKTHPVPFFSRRTPPRDYRPLESEPDLSDTLSSDSSLAPPSDEIDDKPPGKITIVDRIYSVFLIIIVVLVLKYTDYIERVTNHEKINVYIILLSIFTSYCSLFSFFIIPAM
jgi:hypothetical protein